MSQFDNEMGAAGRSQGVRTPSGGSAVHALSSVGATFGKVAVLMGGDSTEREVSLMSGAGVLQALLSKGVDAHAFDPAERDLSDLQREGFARCFIALHGRLGEGGAVQGALELLGIPYTGSGVMASSISMDKVMTKRIWISEGIPTPRYQLLRQGAYDRRQVIAVPDTLGLPVIVKPAREGSSFGVTKVLGYSGMSAAVDAAAQLDSNILCEECIEGDEVTCSVLGNGDDARALPVIRIVAPDGKTRQPYLLEINTSPGMTGHSLVPKSAKAAGISYEDLCVSLLAHAALDVGVL